jgi:hypothetical protein
LKGAGGPVAGILLGLIAGVYQLVIASDPTNDDFLHVVLARQILGGDWPVRDFADFGVWLTYGLSAASQLIIGHRLLSEGVVVAVMLAVSTYLVFRLVRELTGSTLAATLSAVLLIVAGPRGYSYPKIIVYAVAATMWWAYVRQPSLAKAVAFGAWVAVAFYWRGDHGVYVAVCFVLAAWTAHGFSRTGVLRVVQAGGLAFALVTPFLAVVLATVGLSPAVQGATVAVGGQHTGAHMWPDWPFGRPGDVIRLDGPEEFAPVVSLRWTPDSTPELRDVLLARYGLSPVSNDGPLVQLVRLSDHSVPAIRRLINEPIVEDTAGIDRGQATLSTWPVWQRWRFSHWWLRFRVLTGVDEQTRAGNAVAALFYALPLIVFISAGPWLHRYLPDPVTGRRLAVFALVGIVTAFGLMRSPYDVRAVDNVVVPAILFGCCLTVLWRTGAAMGGVRRWLLVTGAVVFALLVVKSVAVAGQFGDRVSFMAGDWRSLQRTRRAWVDVGTRLITQPPLKMWDGRDAPVQIRLAQYADACVPRSKRLLVLFAAPEIYFYADRLMASRHLFFNAAYESLPVEERLTVEKIRRFSPPLVFATSSFDTFTRRMYPGVGDYIHGAYETAGSVEEEGVGYVILLRRNEPVLRSYGEQHWPCMV